MPTVERSQHARFHEDQLAPGAPHGGVKRARVRGLFMSMDQRESEVEFAIADLKAKGLFNEENVDDDIRAHLDGKSTSMDRNFTSGEWEAISWFCRVHAQAEGGRGGIIANYSGMSGGTNLNRDALSAAEYAERSEYAYVVDQLPESHFCFLDWVTRCQYPECFPAHHGQPPGKIRMGSFLFNANDEKYLRGGVDGFFKAVCQLIAEIRGRRATLLNRRRMVERGRRWDGEV